MDWLYLRNTDTGPLLTETRNFARSVHRKAKHFKNWMTGKIFPRTVVLLYHRIAKNLPDPQLLCVSPKHFAEQLEVISKSCIAIPLSELPFSVRNRWSHQPSVILTLDDGYADNVRNALPLLERYGIPATVFVISGLVGKSVETISDTLERIFLLTDSLPEVLDIKIDGKSYKHYLGNTPKQTGLWNTNSPHAPTPRQTCYREIHKLMRPLSSVQRDQVLQELVSWAGCSSVIRSDRLIMSTKELKQISRSGLVEVGAHGVNHLMMSEQTPEVQKYEISSSKNDLENILNYRVTSFAYPYGGRDAVNRIVMKNVQELGFKLACDNFRGAVHWGTNLYSIPRFPVRDWDGDEFFKHLKSFFLE